MFAFRRFPGWGTIPAARGAIASVMAWMGRNDP
jgi:hypothetical protein